MEQQPVYYQPPYQQNNPVNKVGSRVGKGCLMIVGGIVLIIILVIAGILVYPSLTPNKIRGDFQDMAYVPETGMLWIQTDGSFKYIQETESPGYHSVGAECIFCKTYTYIYDPVNKKVIKKIKKETEYIPVKPEIHLEGKNIWIANQDMSEKEAEIYEYNSTTADLLLDTKGFINKYSDKLGAGIASLRFEEDPYAYVIKTKDGREFVYVLGKDILLTGYPEYKAYTDSLLAGSNERIMLGNEASGNSERKKLFKVTGPQDRISSISENNLYNTDYIKSSYESTVETFTPDKVYLEGLIIGNNEYGTAIIYQDKIGKNADRLLTFVSKDGSKSWTKKQDELFGKDISVNEDGPFSDIFFMKSYFSAMILKDLVIFKFEKDGAVAFDINTGKEVWRIEI